MVPVGVEMVLRIRFVIKAAELARFLLGAFDRFYDYAYRSALFCVGF